MWIEREVIGKLEEEQFTEPLLYIIRGGKRLRGSLVIALSEELGGTGDKALRSAAAVELVHASSLALDDIIDLDLNRRGRPAAWVALGVSKTVLVSNYLIPLAQSLVEPLGFAALSEVIRCWLEMTRGELLDAFSPSAPYELVIDLKTSSLFRLALSLAAFSADERSLIPTLRSLGTRLGLAYQVADDLVDICAASKKGTREVAGLSRFVKWLGLEVEPNAFNCGAEVLERGLDKLLGVVREAEEEAKRIGSTAPILRFVPRYMVFRMLKEGLPSHAEKVLLE
ncbi:MAG: polyprenyl synthetase family protein [Fervidicoccaceae archaeon]